MTERTTINDEGDLIDDLLGDESDEPEAPPPRSIRSVRRVVALVAALAVLVGVAVGYSAGYFITRPTHPTDSSAEAGFARDMAIHHAQAVAMGMIAYQKATLPEVRQLGYDIALTQQAQIGIMGTWLRNWELQPTSSTPAMAWMPEGTSALQSDGRMPGMASTAELAKLRAAKGRTVDILFCQLMIRHHLGGVHMAEGLLTQGHDDQVRALANTIKTGQAYEINALRDLLTRLHAKPL